MTEINAYMNGYQPEGDTEFLAASLEAHKKALKESEQKVDDFKKTASLYYEEMMENKQKVERLEKVLNEAYSTIQLTEKDVSGDCDIEVETALNTIENLIIDYWNVDPALETEEKG
jgi:uncharacterized coiled-coil DUF342 family protein